MRYHFKVNKESSGNYRAEGVEVSWACAEGSSIEVLRANMREVLDRCLEEPPKSFPVVPMPDPTIKGENIEEVEPDPKIALALIIRQTRRRAKLTQRQAADLMGIKNLAVYQRLEQGKTANPEWTTLVRLRKAFPNLPVEIALD